MNGISLPNFPTLRMRRIRENPVLQSMLTETRLSPDIFIYPLFVRHGKGIRQPVPSMPGVAQLSIDTLLQETEQAIQAGVRAVLLFGIPAQKDEQASEAYAEDGIVQQAVRALKGSFPELLVITDVCLCEYTSHGHCGIVRQRSGGQWYVDNDSTLELLARTAVSHVAAGADMVAPSDMMDGRIGAIRKALDQAGYSHIPILSYAAKYASSFYGPFREAAESAPKFGDRRSYQMNPANGDEALREVALDIQEGADLIMVKPALAYLDILYRVKTTFGYPTVAYAVSGEFSMIKAAAEKGWLDERAIVFECLTAIRRAGADLIITYFAPQVCRWLQEQSS